MARTVDFALRGTRLPYMKREGREIAVWAQFREEDRKRKTSLDNVSLRRREELVPLNRIVSSRRPTVEADYADQLKNVTTITANVSGEDLVTIKKHLEDLAASFPLPRIYDRAWR